MLITFNNFLFSTSAVEFSTSIINNHKSYQHPHVDNFCLVQVFNPLSLKLLKPPDYPVIITLFSLFFTKKAFSLHFLPNKFAFIKYISYLCKDFGVNASLDAL